MSENIEKSRPSRKSLVQAHPKRIDVVILLILSNSLLVAGLMMPVMTVRKLWEKNTFTILTGIQSLYDDKQYFLTFVVFFFSVIFPIVKLTALYTIWFFPMKAEWRQRILAWLAILGKWSMLDVFVVAVIIVAAKLGVLASAEPEIGIYYFGASVLLAMVTTAFQERLAGRKKTHSLAEEIPSGI